MRKFISFMVAAAAIFSATSCTQELENNVPEQVIKSVEFTAYVDGADTKTALNGYTPEWKSGDRIWILNAKEGDAGWKKAYYTTDDKTTTATFTEEDNSYPLEGDKYFAVYPASAADDATWEGGDVLGVNLKSNQDAVAGSYDPAAHIAVAKSENTNLEFKNAASLFMFTVKNAGVKSVTIYANNGEALTGSCNISAEGNVTPWTGDGEANGWVELSAGEGTFTVGENYYIAIFPNTLEKGFTIEFSFDGSTKLEVTSFTDNVTIPRNQILDLGELEYVAPTKVEKVYLKPGVWASDNAWYAAHFWGNGDSDVKMTDENADGIYEAAVPAGSTNVIFCRMNPEYTEFGWDVWEGETEVENHVWNQSEDLVVPDAGDDKLYYVVSDWEVAAWMTYEDATAEPETPSVTPGQDSEWALIGAFSGWADMNFVTTSDANVVVLENVTMEAAQGFLVRKPSTEWGDKYGAGSVNYLKANHYITTSKDGADMCLEAAGIYDIYFNVSTKAIYVMAAGVDYNTATEQTVNGEEPKQEEPEVTDGNKIYLKPNSNWLVDNARFAVYTWDGGEQWFNMTAVGDGTYEVLLPTTISNIIFCRMNPGTSSNNWNNKWNQTADLTIPTDGKNLYTVADGAWDKGDGTWSTK